MQQLSQAGWDVEGWDAVRDVGAHVDLAAEAEYVGPALDLRLELLAEYRFLVFLVSQPDGEPLLSLRLYPRGDLAVVLAKIIAAQDTLDTDNHPQLIKSLIPLCNPLLIETEEGLFQLS